MIGARAVAVGHGSILPHALTWWRTVVVLPRRRGESVRGRGPAHGVRHARRVRAERGVLHPPAWLLEPAVARRRRTRQSPAPDYAAVAPSSRASARCPRRTRAADRRDAATARRHRARRAWRAAATPGRSDQRRLVPRAHVLADVAAVDVSPPALRRIGGMASSARSSGSRGTPGVEHVRLDDGAGRARVEALRARAAVVGRRRIGIERQAVTGSSTGRSTSRVAADDAGVLADPADAGVLRVDALLDPGCRRRPSPRTDPGCVLRIQASSAFRRRSTTRGSRRPTRSARSARRRDRRSRSGRTVL